jgi:hypothetical protein
MILERDGTQQEQDILYLPACMHIRVYSQLEFNITARTLARQRTLGSVSSLRQGRESTARRPSRVSTIFTTSTSIAHHQTKESRPPHRKAQKRAAKTRPSAGEIPETGRGFHLGQSGVSTFKETETSVYCVVWETSIIQSSEQNKSR